MSKKVTARKNSYLKNIVLKTKNFSTIQKVCFDAHENLRMAAIIGDAGLGKTTALNYYCSQYEDVYIVTVRKSMSANQFYLAVLEELGVYDQDKDVSLHHLLRKVSWILNKNENNNLLIFDEAGKFTHTMLEYLHELRDSTLTTTGIILSGPGYFQDKVQKWVSKNVEGIPELFTRINFWQILSLPSRIEIKALCEAYELLDIETIKNIQNNCKDFRSIMNEITRIKIAQGQV